MVGRSLRRALLGALVAATALVTVAQSASADDELAITVGYGGYAVPGRPFPLTVAVTAEGLFQGELQINVNNAPVSTISRDLEVAGGTTRELTVVAMSGPWDVASTRVELVDRDGTVVAEQTVRFRAPGRTELVGVLPGVVPGGELPESSSVPVDGEALLFELDPERLALGWGAVAPLDIVVATAADLRALGDTASAALEMWINQGGRLLVDEATGSDLPRLPSAWLPDGAAPRAAGLGEVVFTDGAAARGDWASILEPAPTRERFEDGVLADAQGGFGVEPLSWSLGRDAGFDLPGAGTMLAVLGGYVFVAGPLVWFVLRWLRRPGLGWLVVPMVALLFAAGVWVLGSSVRDGVETVHGTVVEVGSAGTVVSTYQLVNSRAGGGVSIPIPDGWWPVSPFDEGAPVPITVDGQGGRDLALRADLDAGGFAVLGVAGPAPALDDAIVVTATSSDDGVVTGTVTSTLDIDLSEVVVFVDQSGENVGDLPAGGTVEFEVSSAPVDPTRGEPIEMRVWRRALPPGWFGLQQGGYDPGPINLSLWSGWAATRSSNARPVGSVVVAGWTESLPSPVDPDVESGRTLFLARGQIAATGGAITDVASARQIVRGPQDLGPDFNDFQVWGGGAMMAFTLPGGDRQGDLVLAVPRGQRRVELFVDGAWRQIPIGIGNAGVFSVPDGAIDARGRVYVKIMLSFDQGIRWRDLSVRTAHPNEDVTQLTWVEVGEA